jgi:hypothetical protein
MPDTPRDRVEALRQAAEGGWQLSDPYAVRKLFRQRDALLAACEALDGLDCCDGYSFPDADWPKLWNALSLARKAIAMTREV